LRGICGGMNILSQELMGDDWSVDEDLNLLSFFNNEPEYLWGDEMKWYFPQIWGEIPGSRESFLRPFRPNLDEQRDTQHWAVSLGISLIMNSKQRFHSIPSSPLRYLTDPFIPKILIYVNAAWVTFNCRVVELHFPDASIVPRSNKCFLDQWILWDRMASYTIKRLRIEVWNRCLMSSLESLWLSQIGLLTSEARSDPQASAPG
jgi:hypothetical protein